MRENGCCLLAGLWIHIVAPMLLVNVSSCDCSTHRGGRSRVILVFILSVALACFHAEGFLYWARFWRVSTLIVSGKRWKYFLL